MCNDLIPLDLTMSMKRQMMPHLPSPAYLSENAVGHLLKNADKPLFFPEEPCDTRKYAKTEDRNRARFRHNCIIPKITL